MAERNLWSEGKSCLSHSFILFTYSYPNDATAKVVYIDNPQYLHLRALQKLATRKQFKEEVITGGLSEHLVHGKRKPMPKSHA